MSFREWSGGEEKMSGVLFGPAYYHEYQPYERLGGDIALMRKAQMSVVRVGESSWSRWEPEDGRIDTWLSSDGGCAGLTGGHCDALSLIAVQRQRSSAHSWPSYSVSVGPDPRQRDVLHLRRKQVGPCQSRNGYCQCSSRSRSAADRTLASPFTSRSPDSLRRQSQPEGGISTMGNYGGQR
jgi:hypothetical protein